MDQIRPSADLRNHYAEISKACHVSKKPVYITVNGRGDTVLIGLTEFEQMKAELELLRMLAEADEDVRSGHVAPMQDTFDGIRAVLKARE